VLVPYTTPIHDDNALLPALPSSLLFVDDALAVIKEDIDECE
jgi:hypothetical protein